MEQTAKISTPSATVVPLHKLLTRLHACTEAVAWASHYSTLSAAWKACERADWMLWLCARMKDKEGWPSHKQVVLAACACAETALRYVPQEEERPRNAIETACAWARGEETSLQQVRSAAAAAAAYADAAAADAAAAAAADAAAKTTALREMATIVRSILTVSEV